MPRPDQRRIDALLSLLFDLANLSHIHSLLVQRTVPASGAEIKPSCDRAWITPRIR